MSLLKAALPSGSAQVAGVLGRPISQSLSPTIHSAWIRALNMDALYIPLSPEDDRGFEKLVRACRGGLVLGFNVTAPFKELALSLVDDCDAAARRAGSVNLLRFHADGQIEGRSTDGLGILGALLEQSPNLVLEDQIVVILGAGGAARAAVAAMLDQGVKEVRIINRTLARAEDLVFSFGNQVRAFDLTQTERAFDGAGLLINAAVGGPIPPLNGLKPGSTVLDMTYKPLKTGLLLAAESQGHVPVDGLSMLIHQARPSFEAFFGVVPPPMLNVRQVCLDLLIQQG